MQEIPVLTTPRFILRPLVRADAAALFASFSDDDHMRWWSCAPFRSEAELADWLCDPNWPGRSWAMVPKEGGLAVARLVAHPKDSGMSEIGYLVARGHERRGIAREGLSALLDQLFRVECQRRVMADVDPDNAASNGLLESLGFTCEGRLRAQWHTHIGVRDSLIWGLLRDEWIAR